MTALFLKQIEFGRMLPRLLDYIHESGKLYTPGQTFRCQNCQIGHKDSLHKKGLAIDINVFEQDGTYLKSTIDHLPFGQFWESIGGTWGGRWGDGNHYSIAYKGMK